MVNIFSFIKDSLLDHENGVCHLMNWFLNLVMEEDLLQSDPKYSEKADSVKDRRDSCKPRTL